jgi:hypothetical protein
MLSSTLSLALVACAPRVVGDEIGDEVDPSSEESTSTSDESTGEEGTSDESTSETGVDIEGLDGVVDTMLWFSSEAAPLGPSLASSQLRIFGWKYTCGSDSCPSTDLVIVRELVSGELLAALFGRVPSDETLAEFGETSATFLAPLAFDHGDYGLCEPYDAGCGDGSVWQRGAIELEHEQGVARLLAQSTGWAAAGYHVDVSTWLLGNGSCQLLPAEGDVFIHRACDDDCPAPTLVASCEAPQDYETIDRARVGFLDVGDDVQGSFDASCEVLSVGADTLGLDCAYSNPVDG